MCVFFLLLTFICCTCCYKTDKDTKEQNLLEPDCDDCDDCGECVECLDICDSCGL